MADILVIDDDEQIRSMLKQILERAEHSVELAEGANEGLESLRNSPADLIIVDILMPGKDGLQAIQELNIFSPTTPIIAISGGMKGNTAWLPIARKVGATRVVKKPFDKDTIISTVSELLSDPS